MESSYNFQSKNIRQSLKNPVPSNSKTGKLFLQQGLVIVDFINIDLVELRKSVAIDLKVDVSEKK